MNSKKNFCMKLCKYNIILNIYNNTIFMNVNIE